MTSLALCALLGGCETTSPPAPNTRAAAAQTGPVAPPAQTPTTGAVQAALRRDDATAAVQLARPLAESGNADAQFVLGLLSDLGAGTRLDHPHALEWLKKSAAQGNPLASGCLAWRLGTGFGLDKPDPQAVTGLMAGATPSPAVDAGLGRWIDLQGGLCVPKFSRALAWMLDQAGEGNALAQGNLAQIYLANQWARPNIEQHLYWLREAAGRKDPPSLDQLADYYEMGLLVPKDPAQAGALRRAAAEAGWAPAQYALGKKFEDGDGVTADASEAAKWYQLAVAQGNRDAVHRLISLWREGGPGLAVDFGEAVRLAQQWSDRGDPEATKNLADLCNRGEGVAVDYPRSARLYREAAAKGVVGAMTMVAWMIQNGEIDPPDYAEALRWNTLAAQKGSEVGMRLLGLLYEEGKGVEKNLPKAFEWFERAARADDGWAQNRLGWMLREGIGIERDDEEAVDWFRLAAKNGEAMGEANLGYHYLHGLGVARDPREAFGHLAASMRAMNDSWATNVMTDLLFKSTPADRDRFKDLLLACVRDPALPQAKGPLPELCISALMVVFPKDYDAELSALLPRLANSGRSASAYALAWHSFIGWDMPYDLAKAREWARVCGKVDPRQGRFLLAVIDSVAADAPADRTAARKALRELADEGDPMAVEALARRLATGDGDDFDPVSAIRYYNLGAAQFGLPPVDSLAMLCRSLGLPPPKDPPTEAELAAKVAALPATGSTAIPRVLYQTAPIYPHDLKESGLDGNATIEFVVEPDGRVGAARVVECTHPLFGVAAEAAVRRWRFSPGKKEGRTVSTRMIQKLIFALVDDDSKPVTSRVRTVVVPGTPP